jgi:hypothetical protein
MADQLTQHKRAGGVLPPSKVAAHVPSRRARPRASPLTSPAKAEVSILPEKESHY